MLEACSTLSLASMLALMSLSGAYLCLNTWNPTTPVTTPPIAKTEIDLQFDPYPACLTIPLEDEHSLARSTWDLWAKMSLENIADNSIQLERKGNKPKRRIEEQRCEPPHRLGKLRVGQNETRTLARCRGARRGGRLATGSVVPIRYFSNSQRALASNGGRSFFNSG